MNERKGAGPWTCVALILLGFLWGERFGFYILKATAYDWGFVQGLTWFKSMTPEQREAFGWKLIESVPGTMEPDE